MFSVLDRFYSYVYLIYIIDNFFCSTHQEENQGVSGLFKHLIIHLLQFIILIKGRLTQFKLIKIKKNVI